MKTKYFIVYKTINTLSGKFYIGSHQTYNLNDGYLGSGKILKLAIKKYGRSNFKREVICKCSCLRSMREVETHLVGYAIDNYGRNCYNRSYSGTGGVLGEGNSFYGKRHKPETIKKISENAKLRVGDKNPFYGKKHTKETIEKIKSNRPNNDTCENMLRYYLEKYTRWYCTPLGCFHSGSYAAKISGLSKATIYLRCLNPDKMVKPNYQIPENYWYKTWRGNGFYFVDRGTGCD